MTKEELQLWVNKKPLTESQKEFAQWVIDSTAVWRYSDRKKTLEKAIQLLTN